MSKRYARILDEHGRTLQTCVNFATAQRWVEYQLRAGRLRAGRVRIVPV